MPSFIVIALGTLVLLQCFRSIRQFRKNIADAKASGIPYVLVPVAMVNRLWQASLLITLPILQSLPQAWTDSWLPLVVEWGWKLRYAPYANIGADTFLTVSPGKIMMNTAEASVVHQVTQRRNDFPKALEVYEMLQIYGKNVVTVEGQEWRNHRKILNPQFGEVNNRLVWKETLAQSQDMIDGWFEADKDRSKTIRTLAEDAMRLSLHIISKASFGVGLKWPGKEDGPASEALKAGKGHEMTYRDALGNLLDHLLTIILFPKFLLQLFPTKGNTTALTAYREWDKYMWEMFEEKKKAILEGKAGAANDLMTAMLKGAGVGPNGAEKDKKDLEQTIQDQEIIGNAFVFILAGHETTANSIHFCLTYLAMHPASQRRLQQDLDDTFKGKPQSEWDHDTYIGQLFGNMAGAVMNEELRLVPPVTGIPKRTEPGKPQTLIIGGKKCVVPGNTYIALMPHAAHRNPNQWPTGPPADPHMAPRSYKNYDNDLEEFKPERWLKTDTGMTEKRSENNEAVAADGSFDITTAPDTSPSLYRPEKGAYFPFSEGFRSCIGRRFAQVELLAFLASVFTRYSVELSVEDWASDAELEKMDEISKREVWEKAKAKVERSIDDDMFSIVTLQLRRGHFALRLVKRGHESFNWK